MSINERWQNELIAISEIQALSQQLPVAANAIVPPGGLDCGREQAIGHRLPIASANSFLIELSSVASVSAIWTFRRMTHTGYPRSRERIFLFLVGVAPS